MAQLREFQQEDVAFIIKHKLRVLIASAQGTGKTPVTVVSLRLTRQWSCPALVVCPASVTINWAREIAKWGGGLQPVNIEGIDAPIPPPTSHTVYVVSWALLDARWKEMLSLGLRTLVADEAHFAKNPDALRSQALLKIAQSCRGLLLLSGTPIVNRREELDALYALYGTRKPPMLRRLLEDVAPDIPPKKRAYLHIRLRPRKQEEYDRAVDDFEEWLRKKKEALLGEGMAETEVERAMAQEALVKIGYLRRLSGEGKVPAAADWISQAVRIGEPVVVFVEYQSVLHALSKSLKKQRIRHVIIEGKTSPKKRQAAIDAFQRNEYPVLIATKAGKEGITLTAARHLLFVERYYTCAEEEQAEARVHRISQRYPSHIWFLHALGTVDDRIDAIVKEKRRIVRTAIGSAETEETPLGNVERLLRSWSSFVSIPDHKPSALGLGQPLPPLPLPSLTHGVVFASGRWTTRAGKAWCVMNGYLPVRIEKMHNRFKVVIHPADTFRASTFRSRQVSSDIKVIVGDRGRRTR